MGRPPLPAEKARRNRVVTFLTDLELESLRYRAQREGLSLSASAHQILARCLTARGRRTNQEKERS